MPYRCRCQTLNGQPQDQEKTKRNVLISYRRSEMENVSKRKRYKYKIMTHCSRHATCCSCGENGISKVHKVDCNDNAEGRAVCRNDKYRRWPVGHAQFRDGTPTDETTHTMRLLPDGKLFTRIFLNLCGLYKDGQQSPTNKTATRYQ